MKEFFKKYKIDTLVIGIILLISLIISLCFIYIPKYESNLARIYVSNNLVEEINLTKEKEERLINVNAKHGEVIVLVKYNEIKIKESNCLTKECINMGKATPLKPIICAYNEVYIEIIGLKDLDVELG